jgi:heptosyltransferase-2
MKAGKGQLFLIGAPSDKAFLDEIISAAEVHGCLNLAGKLSLLESAYLIKNARQTYVNDSAPMHLASAMNAPVTAFFCSTIPAFGFAPLSEKSVVVETQADLNCRPCGLHGFKECPKGHFDCGTGIQLDGL